jgi:hypothetical protein
MGNAPGGIAFELIFWVIGTLLFRYLGSSLGRAIVWLATLGRYPTSQPTPAQKVAVFTVGAIALIAGLVAVRNLLWP